MARLTGWALAVGALGLSALPAQAQTSFLPVPPATVQPRVLLSQGDPPAPATPNATQLYDVTQGLAATALDFTNKIGVPSAIQYNSIGYHSSDGYIYGIRVDTNATAAGRANSNHLVRVDAQGLVTDLGAVTGLPTSTAQAGADPSGYAAGTFGDGIYANTLFVRRGTTAGSTALYAVDITNVLSNPTTAPTFTPITMSVTLPNTADLVWNQGYLWTVYGTGTTVTMYRIDPRDGAINTFSLPVATTPSTISTAGIIAQTYGAQWVYNDNGSDSGLIGISGNGNGSAATAAAYKIQITNGTSTTPTFTILSALGTDLTTQNDATSIIGPPVDLALTKTASAPASDGTVTYTFTITNNSGPGINSSGSTLKDTLPADITNITPISPVTGCTTTPATPPATGTQLTCNVDALVSGASEVITVSAKLAAGETFTNTATVIGNETDPNTDNNTASVTSSMAQPVLSITKTDGSSAALTTGGTVQYTVTVTNNGAVDAAGTRVTDPAPAGILVTGSKWTCSPTTFCGSAGQLSTGTNLLDDTLTSLPPGNSVTYLITAQVVSTGLPAVVTNVASATPPAGGLCADSSTPPCIASVDNPAVPTVSITKTADAQTTPGGQVIYTVTVDNTGSLDASGTVVQDPLPTNIDSVTWTCTASGGAACPGTGSGSAALNQTLATFPAGSNVVYKITAKVNASVVVGTTLKNTATITPPTNGLCSQSGCSAEADTAVVGPVLGITKTPSTTAALVPSTTGAVTYTVTVANTGPVDAVNANVTDPLPTGIASFKWSRTCAPATVCAAVPDITNRTTALNDTLTIPASATVTYQIVATTDTSLPAAVQNTAKVTLPTPASGVCADTTPLPCSASASNPAEPVMSITKTVDQATTSDGKVTYTIKAANTGPVDASNVTVQDPLFVTGVTYSWSCAPTGGATCPSPDSGTGAINATADFPVGSSAVYTVKATLPANVTRTQLSNEAKVSFTDSVCAPCSSSASAAVTVLAPFGVAAPTAAVPTLDARELALLAALLAALAWFSRRKAKQ